MPKHDSALKRSAGFSRCGRYRYWLGRDWDATKPRCLFIGLNPSTADAEQDDPTIRRIMGFARDWGFGGVTVANLFAFKATFPADLKAAEHPVGPRNNYWLRRLSGEASLIMAAWGNDGQFRERDAYALRNIPELHCLGLTQSGHPRHPLYVRKTARPVPFNR